MTSQFKFLIGIPMNARALSVLGVITLLAVQLMQGLFVTPAVAALENEEVTKSEASPISIEGVRINNRTVASGSLPVDECGPEKFTYVRSSFTLRAQSSEAASVSFSVAPLDDDGCITPGAGVVELQKEGDSHEWVSQKLTMDADGDETRHVITITADDGEGNEITHYIGIIKDDMPPEIKSFTVPSSSGKSFGVSATVTDDNEVGKDGVEFFVAPLDEQGECSTTENALVQASGIQGDANGFTATINVSAGLEGQYCVFVSAKDTAGNASTASQKMYIDSTAPIITINPPAGSGPTPVLTGTINDSNAIISLTINGVLVADSLVPNGNIWSYAVTDPLGAGNNTITVFAADTMGNISEPATIAFSVVLPVNNNPQMPVKNTVGPEDGIDDGETPKTSEEEEKQTFTQPINQFALFRGEASDVLGVQGSTNDSDDDNSGGPAGGVDDQEEGTPLTDTPAVLGVADNNFLGVTWYWWTAILVGLIGAWLAIAAMIRRRRAES